MDDNIKPELVRLANRIVASRGIDALTSFKDFPEACGCMGPADGDVLCPCAQSVALEENLIAITLEVDDVAGRKIIRK